MRALLFPLILIVGLGLFSFVGFVKDPEFSETHVIIKPEPSLKFFFHSPIGESDKSFESLTEMQQMEETAFQDVWAYKGFRANFGTVLLITAGGLILVGTMGLTQYRKRIR